jgi:hypothetical protein
VHHGCFAALVELIAWVCIVRVSHLGLWARPEQLGRICSALRSHLQIATLTERALCPAACCLLPAACCLMPAARCRAACCQAAGLLAAWLPGCLVAWLPGCLAVWLPGCLAAWLPGCLAAWLPGCLKGLLPAVCCLLPAACCLLPTACCLLPAACCSLPAARCLLPAACCLVPGYLLPGCLAPTNKYTLTFTLVAERPPLLKLQAWAADDRTIRKIAGASVSPDWWPLVHARLRSKRLSQQKPGKLLIDLERKPPDPLGGTTNKAAGQNFKVEG